MPREVIYINKGEKLHLPPKFRPANNVCAILYDMITEVFHKEVYKPLLKTNIEFKTPDGIEKMHSFPHVLDFLKEKGLNDELTEILVKHVTLSIVTDLLNFVFESISCAKRGKMVVAYALLRKPFKDELLLLESMLVDPTGFINKFFHDGNPNFYDPSKLTSEEKEILIEKATKKTSANLFSSKILNEFRFDKNSRIGISGFSDHALHIVTNNKNYRTSEQNLNFVFSTHEEVKGYWQHFYTIVPYLLLYTVAVVDGILFEYLPGKQAQKHRQLKVAKLYAGYYMWLDTSFHKTDTKLKNTLKDFNNLLYLECDNCKYKWPIDKADIELFFFEEILLCAGCLELVPVEEILEEIVKLLNKDEDEQEKN